MKTTIDAMKQVKPWEDRVNEGDFTGNELAFGVGYKYGFGENIERGTSVTQICMKAEIDEFRAAIAREEAQSAEAAPCEVCAMRSVEAMSKIEEAQTVEPGTGVVDPARSLLPFCSSAAPSGERAAYISELRSAFIDVTLHATKANKIADMLSSDAQEIARLRVIAQDETARCQKQTLEIDALKCELSLAADARELEDSDESPAVFCECANCANGFPCLNATTDAQQVAVPQERKL